MLLYVVVCLFCICVCCSLVAYVLVVVVEVCFFFVCAGVCPRACFICFVNALLGCVGCACFCCSQLCLYVPVCPMPPDVFIRLVLFFCFCLCISVYARVCTVSVCFCAFSNVVYALLCIVHMFYLF